MMQPALSLLVCNAKLANQMLPPVLLMFFIYSMHQQSAWHKLTTGLAFPVFCLPPVGGRRSVLCLWLFVNTLYFGPTWRERPLLAFEGTALHRERCSQTPVCQMSTSFQVKPQTKHPQQGSIRNVTRADLVANWLVKWKGSWRRGENIGRIRF